MTTHSLTSPLPITTPTTPTSPTIHHQSHLNIPKPQLQPQPFVAHDHSFPLHHTISQPITHQSQSFTPYNSSTYHTYSLKIKNYKTLLASVRVFAYSPVGDFGW
ncbi:hypothetical protein OCU04_000228 [Sclerotinia nivalis]|uniref:Uncharacterized protein n=1 Tax=Sclerotinia nivalis TaxID=352851 RepID=A0A9X0DR33_9HELO|nr:hypothetical protein OCU04_000228 [Sclerotinia nivalis]